MPGSHVGRIVDVNRLYTIFLGFAAAGLRSHSSPDKHETWSSQIHIDTIGTNPEILCAGIFTVHEKVCHREYSISHHLLHQSLSSCQRAVEPVSSHYILSCRCLRCCEVAKDDAGAASPDRLLESYQPSFTLMHM